MNLDELQIKISIELDDLNKQLKSITKGIDEALGPKATKKLMDNNNKVVKSGLTAINKTTLNLVKKSRKDTTKEVEAMSKDINKSLTKAFDIDLTKFNSNITSAMNQARITVRSACNDIKRELNAALNIKGNIRVTSKASVSGSATGSSDSNVASNMASSQYIGAMIIKATNAIIAENKANTLQLKQEINQSTNKIVSAIRKINTKATKADSNKTQVNVPDVNVKISGEDINVTTDNSDLVSEINKLGNINHEGFKVVAKNIDKASSDIVSAIKSINNGFVNNGNVESYPPIMRQKAIVKELPYGSNQLIGGKAAEGYVNFTRGGTGVLDTSQVEAMKKAFKQVRELMKQIHNLGKGIPSDTTSFTIGEEQSQSLTGKVIDSEKLTKNKGIPQKEVVMPESFKVIDDELAKVIKECVERIQKLSKNALAPGFELGDEGSQTLRGKVIDKAKNSFTQGIGVKDVIEGTFREVGDVIEVLPPVIKKAADEIEKATTTIRKATGAMPGSKNNPTKTETTKQAPSYVHTDKEAPKNTFDGVNSNSTSAAEQVKDTMQKIKNTWENAESMDLVQGVVDAIDVTSILIAPMKEELAKLGKIIAGELVELGDSPLNSPKKVGQPNGEQPISKKKTDLSQLDDIKAKLQEVNGAIEDTLVELSYVNSAWEEFNSIKDFIPVVDKLIATLNALEADRIKLKIDTSDAQNQIEAARIACEMLKDELSTGNINAVRKLFPDAQSQTSSTNKKKYPPKVVGKGGSGASNKSGKPPKPTIMGFGFGAYKNEIDSLIEYAKKAGAKIKNALFSKSKNGSDELAMTIDTDGDSSQVFEALNESINNLINAINDLNESITKLIGRTKTSTKGAEKPLASNTDKFDGVYKDQLDGLASHAKSTGAKIKEALSAAIIAGQLKLESPNGSSKPASEIEQKTPEYEGYHKYEKAMDDFSRQIEETSNTTEKEILEIRRAGEKLKSIMPKTLSQTGMNSMSNALQLSELGVKVDKANMRNKMPNKQNLLENQSTNIHEDVERYKNMISDIFQGLSKQLPKTLSGLDFDDRVNGIKDMIGEFENLNKILDVLEKSLNNEKLKNAELGLDTSELEKDERAIKDLIDLVNDFKKALNKSKISPKHISTPQLETYSRRAQHAGEVAYGEGGSDSLGFSAYRNELGRLANLGKKVFANIRKYIKIAFHSVEGPARFNFALTRIEKKAVSVFNKIKNKAKTIFSKVATPLANSFSKVTTPIKKTASKIVTPIKSAMSKASALTKNYGITIKAHLNKALTGIKSTKLYTSVASGLNKAKSAVSKFSSKVKPILNKAFDGAGKVASKIGTNISKGLNKAKSALQKFANGCKTIWGKIKQVFSKGANDASKATGKLTSGLKGLLSQALGFVSLYGLINLGRQAITQSQELAQAEIKLASLMKQRMGATNETVLAIRQLAEEQAKLGVVSETAMKSGAQQLSMYVHSAKALKELMPAIANLTAKRGGFNATPDDAMEVATQLGEAIREGTTTPLEQSGIYLSEKEIEKFSKLRTEEERAEYLARRIAQDVGDINKALANTPHGAIAQLKNNFQSLLGTLGIFLANVIKPIVQWLNVIVVACNNALKALGKLLGFDMTGGTLEVGNLGTGSTEVDTGGVEDVTDSLEDTTDAAEEAEEAVEKFKGSLAGFDEINILTDNTDKNKEDNPEDDPTNITPGEGGQLIPEVGDLTEGENIFDKFSDKMKAFIDEVLEPFKNAWALLGDDLKAEWADLQKSFKNFCDKLGQFLKSVWENGGKEFVQHMAEIALAVAKAAMEIGGEILDSLARLWEHLDPKNNEHTQRFLDYLNDTAEKLRDFLLGLGDHFESLMANGGQDVLNALGDCFMDLGAAAVKGLGLAIDALDALIDHLDPANNENTKNMLKAWADMFHAIGQTALDFVDLLESCLLNGGQDMINAFGDMMMNLGQATAEVITTMMKSFSELFKYLDPATNEITRGMMKSWEEAFLAIGQAALSFSSLFKSIMENGGQDVLNALGDCFNSILGLVGDIVKEIADALNGLFEHLDPKTNNFTRSMLKAWEEAFKGISELCQSFSKLISSTMDNGGQEIVNSIGDLAMKIGEAFGVVIDEFAGALTELFDHMDPSKNKIAKDMMESLDKLVDSITGFVDACIKSFKNFMDNGGREFIKNLGDILAIVIDLAAAIGSGIIELITEFINSFAGQEMIKNCAELLEWVTEKLVGLKDAVEIIKNAFQDVIDIIVGILEGDGEKVGRAFANLIKNAFKLTTELTQWLLDIGKDIILGLIEGIKSIPGLLLDAIVFIKDLIVGFFKELFGIHSPSTVFAELGVNLIEGLIEGIKSLVSGVKDAIAAVGDAIFGTVEEVVSFVADKWKELYDTTVEKWNSTKEIVVEKCSDIYNNAKEKYQSLKDTVADSLESVRKSSEEKWNTVKQKTSDIVSNIRQDVEEKYSKFKDMLSTHLENWRQSSETIWGNIKEKTSSFVSDIKTDVEDKYEKLKDKITDCVDKVKQHSEDTWGKVKDKTIDFASKIKSDVEDKYESLKNALTDKLNTWKKSNEDTWKTIKETGLDTFDKLRTTGVEAFETLKTNLSSNMDTLKSKLTSAMEEIRNDLVTKWEDIKTKAIDAATKVKTDVENAYNELKSNLGSKLEEVRSEANKKWGEIKSATTTSVKEVVTEATNRFGEMKESFTKKIDEVKTALTPKWTDLKNSVKTNAQGVATKVTEGLSGLKQKFTKPFEEAQSTISSIITKIGNTLKNTNWSLPKIKLPHISVSGKFSLDPPSVPSFSIQWYKRGGIIDGLTPLGFANGSLHMGGEAGKEMVVPLENTSFTSKIAQAIGQAVDNALARQANPYNNNNNSANDNRNIVLQINDREFARASINSINKLQRESGKTLLDI